MLMALDFGLAGTSEPDPDRGGTVSAESSGVEASLWAMGCTPAAGRGGIVRRSFGGVDMVLLVVLMID